jgi:hypothetical protein
MTLAWQDRSDDEIRADIAAEGSRTRPARGVYGRLIADVPGLLARAVAAEAAEVRLRHESAELRDEYAIAAPYYAMYHDAARRRNSLRRAVNIVRSVALRFGEEYNADNPSAMAQDIDEHVRGVAGLRHTLGEQS